MTYIPRDFWRYCDRCGKKIRRSKTRKTWDQLWVCAATCWEPRHPQDFVKGRKDVQAVVEPRPEQTDYFLSDNEVTAEDL